MPPYIKLVNKTIFKTCAACFIILYYKTGLCFIKNMSGGIVFKIVSQKFPTRYIWQEANILFAKEKILFSVANILFAFGQPPSAFEYPAIYSFLLTCLGSLTQTNTNCKHYFSFFLKKVEKN